MEKQEIRTFGRRHGKKISPRQQFLTDNVLPAISPINIEKAGNLILEIGFGAGEHLRELALANPGSIVIGAEPFMNGVASLLSAITSESDNSIKDEYKNIRIWPDDVRILLNNSTFHIPHSTLMQNPYLHFAQIWILHPDPWPKARHEKRRLLNSEFLNLLASHLTADGKIIIGTDHHEYYDWILAQATKTTLQSEITNHKSEIIKTRYQQKNKAGTDAPKYLILKK